MTRGLSAQGVSDRARGWTVFDRRPVSGMIQASNREFPRRPRGGKGFRPMQNPLFKLTALAGVIGAGAMIVIEAQRHLADGSSEDATRFAMLSATPGDNGAQTVSPPTEKQTTEEVTLPPAQSEGGETAAVSVSGPTSTGQPRESAEPDADPFSFLYADSQGPSGAQEPRTEPASLPSGPTFSSRRHAPGPAGRTGSPRRRGPAGLRRG